MKFKVGDRVQRLSNVFKPDSWLLKGEVVKAYSYTSKHFGYYPEMFDVLWGSCDSVAAGYLPHGLQPEEVCLTQTKTKS